MAKAKIPTEVRTEAISIIEKYNAKKYKKFPGISYYPVFKGAYLYLNRKEGYTDGPISRLKYNGSMEDWDFEIFKWSSESYSDDLFMMPGEEYIDGSIEGAMKAGDTLYPPDSKPDPAQMESFLKGFSKLMSELHKNKPL